MKVIGWLLGLVVIALIAAGAYVFYFSGDLVKQAIEAFGPDYMGADVSVRSVDLDLAGGSGAINGLEVGNPAGFDGAYAMRVGTMAMTLDPAESTSELIVVKELTIDGASLAAVARGRQTNLQKLMDNVEAATGPSEESTMAFIVDRFAFTNADVSLDSDILGTRALAISDIRLTGVGRKSNGATASELVQQLMGPITSAVGKAAVKQGLDLEGIEADVKTRVEDKLREEIGGGLRKLTDQLSR